MSIQKLAILLSCSVSVGALSAACSARRAISGTYHFLGGQYLELGISTNGKLEGSGAPSTFHPPQGDGWVGLVADSDGLCDGIDLKIDYFRPGEPEERYAIAYTLSGTTYSSTLPSGTVTSGVNGTKAWAGIAATFGSLQVKQRIELEENANNFKNTVELKNVGATTLADVVFSRSFDPDNTVYKSGSYSTINTVDKTYPVDGVCIVSGKSLPNENYQTLSGKQAVIAYVSYEPTCRGSIGTSGLAPSGPTDPRLYDSAAPRGTSLTADSYISMTMKFPSLMSGQTKTFVYYTVLDAMVPGQEVTNIVPVASPDPSSSPISSASASQSSSPSRSQSPVPSISPRSSESPSGSVSPVPSPSPLESPIPSKSPIASASESPIPSKSPIASASESPIPSKSPIASASESPIPSKSPIASASESPIPSKSPIASASESPIPSKSPIASDSESPIPSESPIASASESPIPSKSPIASASESPIPSASESQSPSPKASASPSPNSSESPSASPQASASVSLSPSASPAVPSQSASSSPSPSPWNAATWSTALMTVNGRAPCAIGAITFALENSGWLSVTVSTVGYDTTCGGCGPWLFSNPSLIVGGINVEGTSFSTAPGQWPYRGTVSRVQSWSYRVRAPFTPSTDCRRANDFFSVAVHTEAQSTCSSVGATTQGLVIADGTTGKSKTWFQYSKSSCQFRTTAVHDPHRLLLVAGAEPVPSVSHDGAQVVYGLALFITILAVTIVVFATSWQKAHKLTVPESMTCENQDDNGETTIVCVAQGVDSV